MMRSLLLGLLATLAVGTAMAQTPPQRVLPAITLSNPQGQAVTTEQLRMSQPWVLAVVDPSLPSAEALLGALLAKESVWTERLTLLLLRPSQSLEERIAKEPRLATVRVVIATTPAVMNQLDVAGLPALLGIKANQEIAWTRAGLPRGAARLDKQVGGWLATESAAAQ